MNPLRLLSCRPFVAAVWLAAGVLLAFASVTVALLVTPSQTVTTARQDSTATMVTAAGS